MFDEGFATGNDAIVDELCSPDLVEHQFGLAGTRRGGDRARQGGHPRRARRCPRHALHHRGLRRRRRPRLGAGAGPRDQHRRLLRAAPRASRSTSRCSTRRASSTVGSSSTGECPTGSPCWPRPGCSRGWAEVRAADQTSTPGDSVLLELRGRARTEGDRLVLREVRRAPRCLGVGLRVELGVVAHGLDELAGRCGAVVLLLGQGECLLEVLDGLVELAEVEGVDPAAHLLRRPRCR